MPKLSDNQIGDRLHAALEAIGTNEGETIRGNTALVAARHSGLGATEAAKRHFTRHRECPVDKWHLQVDS